MMEMDTTPLVSVVLPIHNSAKYLRDCLDALVNQTFDCYEILIVENGSTDETLEISYEYEAKYPEIVHVYSIPPAKTSAEGRSYGFRQARGEYIYSCDGDDLIDPRALELLYKKAKENNSDIVIGRTCSYFDGTMTISSRLPECITIRELCYKQNPAFWTRLIKRDLILKMGDIPTDIPLSDVAYIIPLTTYATSVSVLNWPPIYHYFRRDGSEVNTVFLPDQLDIITPEKIALKKTNFEYRDEVLYHIAIRIRNNIKNRWYLMDLIIPWLRELWPDFEKNKYILSNKALFRSLSGYVKLNSEPMACVIYVNGFNEDHTTFNKIGNSTIFPFWNLDRCIELSESNCDINENQCIKEAYDSGNFEFVAHYFALKNIYQTGGIYLGKDITIDIPFNYVRYFGCFFGYIDCTNFTDQVFGGQKNNEVIEKILKTYTEPNFDSYFVSLSQRIRNVLVMEYGQKLEGKTYLSSAVKYVVFGPEVLIVNPYTNSVFPNLHLSTCACNASEFQKSDNVFFITDRTLQTVIKNCSACSSPQSIAAQRELSQIKSSNTWKIAQKLRDIGDGRFGPFLKRFFYFAMKLYKKIKK